MKKALLPVFVLLIIFTSMQTALAADFDCALAVESKVQTGKSFNAEIAVSGGGDVAAAVFTVFFDCSAVEYKSSKLIDGIGGQLEAYCDNDTLKLVFLNTKGVPLSADGKPIISIKFKALSSPSNSSILLYGEQAVSSDENRLSSCGGTEYSIELAEKVSTSPSLAKGEKTSKSVTEQSKKSKSAGSGAAQNQGSEVTASSKKQSSAVSLGSDSDGNFMTVTFIIVIALCLICASFGIYTFGKSRAKIEDEQTSGSDKKQKKPADNPPEQSTAKGSDNNDKSNKNGD